jgi:hypothetical protein
MSTVHEPSSGYQPEGTRNDSIGDLLGQVTRDLSQLVSQEIALAKAEARESATRAGRGAGMLAGAAMAGSFVLLFLSISLWWGLGNQIGRGWSALVVAAIWAVIALVLSMMGRSEMKKTKGLPHTVETTKEIPDALRGREETR